MATAALAKNSVSYNIEQAPPGTIASVKLGDKVIQSFEGGSLTAADFKTKNAAFAKELGAALKTAGYPAAADQARMNKPLLVGLLTLLVIYVTMVYGPIAAMLVEMFPTRIRYTSMSLPYHIGNGWFGGFLPTIAFALVAAKRQHLLRPVVSHHRGGDHPDHRHAVHQGDEGQQSGRRRRGGPAGVSCRC